MGILMMIFLQKLKKEKFLKVLYMGISKIFSKKKMENQHFLHVFRIHAYADLDIIFHQNKENENILHFMEILTYRSFDNIFNKKNREMNVGYICRSVTQTYQEKYLADDKYAPFGTSYSTEVLLKNDTQKVIAAVFGDIKQKICELCASQHF